MGNDNAQQRLIKVFEYLRFNNLITTQAEFANAIGVRSQHLNNAFHGDTTRLTKGLFKRIADTYGDYVSAQWLIDGVGEMVVPDRSATRPHLPLAVAAGPTGVTCQSVMADECEFVGIVPNFPLYEFSVKVTGDSMMPALMDGDTIYCRSVDTDAPLDADAFYVVDSTEGAVLKHLQAVPDGLRCVSENPAYAPYIIPAASVLKIYRVVGFVRALVAK